MINEEVVDAELAKADKCYENLVDQIRTVRNMLPAGEGRDALTKYVVAVTWAATRFDKTFNRLRDKGKI